MKRNRTQAALVPVTTTEAPLAPLVIPADVPEAPMVAPVEIVIPTPTVAVPTVIPTVIPAACPTCGHSAHQPKSKRSFESLSNSAHKAWDTRRRVAAELAESLSRSALQAWDTRRANDGAPTEVIVNYIDPTTK